MATQVSKAAEQWNTYHLKINYDTNLGEVIFNDVLVNSFPLSGPDWAALLQKSKFNKSEDYPYLGDARWYDFGTFLSGHICFQDHSGKAFFRNIRIRVLDWARPKAENLSLIVVPQCLTTLGIDDF